MEALLSLFSGGNITFTLFCIAVVVFLLSIIAAGKIQETMSLWGMGLLSYMMCIGTGEVLIAEIDSSIGFQSVLESIPFGMAFAANTKTGIRLLLNNDIASFAHQLLLMFILMTFAKIATDALSGLFAWGGEFNNVLVKVFLPLLLRYLTCALIMVVYTLFAVYALSTVPNAIMSILAYSIFILTALVVLTPLIEYILVLAKIHANPVLTGISKFVKENRLGGNLQAVFFSTLLTTSTMIILCETEMLMKIFG